MSTLTRDLLLMVFIPVLALLTPRDVRASEPTLVRLVLRASPERMGELEAAYQAHRTEIALILARHGLRESDESARAPKPGFFTPLFEIGNPSQLDSTRRQLGADPAWKLLLRELAKAGLHSGSGGAPRAGLSVYASPDRPGKVVPAGRGRGHWRTFSTADGLAGSTVNAIMQDSDRNIWFATSAGASRYDGRHFTTYTMRDGLPSNDVRHVMQDSRGRFWFATAEGASRYDGSTWETFSVDEGLPGRRVPVGMDRSARGTGTSQAHRYGSCSPYCLSRLLRARPLDGD